MILIRVYELKDKFSSGPVEVNINKCINEENSSIAGKIKSINI